MLTICACGGVEQVEPPVAEEVVVVETAVPGPTAPPPTDLPEPTATPLPPTATSEPTPAPPSFELSADIAYVRDKNPKHTLDVYLPLDGEAPYPTLFMLHPGGFEDGSKEWMLPFASYFAAQGYASVVPNYRLMPEAIYPAQLQDSFCALAWTHANVERFGLDPARIVTFGYSAGANLAGMIGAVDDPIPYLEDCSYTLFDDWTQGVIVLAGRTNLADYPTAGLATYLGGTVDEVPELWQEAAPVTFLDDTDPPCMVTHGEVDGVVPFEVSEKYVAALTEAGIEHVFTPIPGADHYFPMAFESEQTGVFLTAASEFLETLAARPPVMESPYTLMTSAEELVGLWQRKDATALASTKHHVAYYKYMEDGRFISEVDTTEFSEFSNQGDYWFEDGIFYLEFDNANNCDGRVVVGSYEVRIIAEDQITFQKVSDTCSAAGRGGRASLFQSVWERIE